MVVMVMVVMALVMMVTVMAIVVMQMPVEAKAMVVLVTTMMPLFSLR